MANSVVVEKTITVLEQVAAPVFYTFGPPYAQEGEDEKTYIMHVNLTIASSTPNSTVYYTTGTGLIYCLGHL